MKARWIFAGSLLLSALVAGACATSASQPDNTGGGGDGGSGATGGTTTTTTTATGGSGGSGGSQQGGGGAGATGGEGGQQPNLCGNAQVDPGEACDGSDFGGKTCATLGLGSGTLVCNSFCGIVATGCVPLETCGDFQDNDQDGLADCDDPDCTGAVVCTDSCAQPIVTTVPDFPFGDTTGRPNTLQPSCTPSSGSEVVYSLTAAADGDIAVFLYGNGFADFTLSVRTSCDDAASEIVCKNDQNGANFNPEVATIAATAGTTYFIVVDGATPADKGSYSLSIDIPFPEQSCNDFSDDDADGFVDCDDPMSCQGTFECQSGASLTGAPCFQNNQCAAVGGDPVCLPDWKGWPGGYCSQFCDVAAPDCQGDSICVDLNLSAHGVCLDGCSVDGDCRPQYSCEDKGLASKVCAATETACNDLIDNDGDALTDCEDGSKCKTMPDCAPGAKAVGQPCVFSNECTSANGQDPLCLSQNNTGWTGGYCSEFCNLAADDCGAGSLCSDWAWSFPSGAGQCLDTCASQAECRPGYVCLDIGLAQSVCVF